MNNGFTGPADIIDTTSDYPAANNNYATVSGTTGNFNLTFEFAAPTDIAGLHVWNYIFRNGATAGSTSGASGINGYTLTFFDSPAAGGAVIGTVFSGNLEPARFNAPEFRSIRLFPNSYPGRARSSCGSCRTIRRHLPLTGLNEVAFGGTDGGIHRHQLLHGRRPVAERPATPVLELDGDRAYHLLTLTPGVGDVLALTTNGSGSIPVSPLGKQTHTLTLNGSIQKAVSVVGLPPQEKVHLYLLIGQSNMQGAGAPTVPPLDAPIPRVMKFGSRNGMESVWVRAVTT